MDSSSRPEPHYTSDRESETTELPHQAQIALQQVDNLKYFLISAPVDWANDQYIRRFLLPTGEYVSCVLWGNLFHISGTDIVRCLAFRFHAFGRPVKNHKKFEEGIFSDLRNLKAGNDASLEDPKSPFLDFLYKHNCIRTQKKQKVFYWYSVPHDRLFLDALERDLKREMAGQETTSVAEAEPALSFQYDASQSLFDQLNKSSLPRNSAGLPDDGEHRQSPDAIALSNKTVSQSSLPHVHRHLLNDQMTYSQTTMPNEPAGPMMMSTSHTTTGPTNNVAAMSYGSTATSSNHPNLAYDYNGIPYDHLPQRHASLPSFVAEASPAPSFVSTQSFYEDYSRGVSYEPVTPPQAGYQSYGTDMSYPTTADENIFLPIKADNGHFSSSSSQPQPFTTPQRYPSSTRTPTPSSHHRYGSLPRQMPTSQVYKQSKPSHGITYRSPYTTTRPSDLRRSMSASLGSVDPHTQRAMSGPPSSHSYMDQLGQTPNGSRHCSPMHMADGQLPMNISKRSFSSVVEDDGSSYGYGPTKRARSVTIGDMTSPEKANQCPIPGCTSSFKRSEHLKRHVRTHTNDRPYQCEHCGKRFSRSDNLSQHKKIHEYNEEQTFPEEGVMAQDSFPSEQSDLYDFAQDTQASAGTSENFITQDSFNGSDTFTSNESYYVAPGSMGPPPLPLHVQGF